MRKYGPWLLSVVSAGVLTLAFPRTDIWVLAWGGLIPLLFALDGKTPWAAFRISYLCGLLFFAANLYWFFNIARWFSWIAAVGVSLFLLYLALYFGIFGLIYGFFSRRTLWAKLFLLPCAWVALEFVRGHLFTGFDWASLGHSQYKNPVMIQIADITGVFGVSFLVVMANILIKELIGAFLVRRTSVARWALAAPAMVGVVVFVLAWQYGIFRLRPADRSFRSLPQQSVAVIQANIPQEMKWHRPARAEIVQEHIALSQEALLFRPDLIVWPETSCPDYLWEEDKFFKQIQSFVRAANIPLLFGSVIKEGNDYYNAAILLSAQGNVEGIYRKRHLVPFGEFIPLRRFLPFLSDLLGIGDFSRGEEYTVFSFSNPRGGSGAFAALVCFEDTVARLSRQFIRKGAPLLVNITNDAWFGNTKAPFLHLQSSIFRAVENRRGLVRAANTGVSCAIDSWGRIVPPLQVAAELKAQKTYVSGYLIAPVSFNDRKTFYTKFGDVFAILCFGCILMGVLSQKKNIKA
ncbi:MAG TPA: apolipoprotein N-acyltransferase [Candidatus Omnitrophota bacterium]|nr:apolipoprotein N-acyltransferase [Candidatus Omnitrophota bacterium]